MKIGVTSRTTPPTPYKGFGESFTKKKIDWKP